MKRVHRGSTTTTCLLITLLAASTGAVNADDAPARCYRVDGITFSNLTGQPGVSSTTIDSSLRVLLRQQFVYRVLDRKNRTSITGVPCRRIANVLAQPPRDREPCASLYLDVDLEQVQYGRVGEDVKNGLIGYALFGDLALAAPGSMGQDGALIEYRVRIWRDGKGDTLSAVGVGIAVGPLEKLSRREAMKIADRRALWDLAGATVEKMNDGWGLQAKSKVTTVNEKEFARRMDSWSEDGR